MVCYGIRLRDGFRDSCLVTGFLLISFASFLDTVWIFGDFLDYFLDCFSFESEVAEISCAY